MRMKQDRRIIYIGVAAVLVVALVIAIAVPLSLRDSDEDNDNDDNVPVVTAATLEVTSRINCVPGPEAVTEAECTAKGCVFDKWESTPCYRLEMKQPFLFQQTSGDTSGIKGVLTSLGMNGTRNRWKFNVVYINDNVLRFTMSSDKEDRFTVPIDMKLSSKPSINKKYEFKLNTADTFGFQVIRKETGKVIWDTNTQTHGLILTDQLLQISTLLPSKNVYGLGEHNHDTLRHRLDKTWPSWARDASPSYDDNVNVYGVHPFHTCVEDEANGNSHGVLLINSNAQEYAFSTTPTLTYRTIGGILDFYIFMGPTPENVVQQYNMAVGPPVMPPYWGLGFQLCRYGYMNKKNLLAAVDSVKKYNIPQDVQYVDIDHMKDWRDFTIDDDRFPDLNDYFHELRNNGMRIIYLLDPCLMVDNKYEAYKIMDAADGAIHWSPEVAVPSNVNGSKNTLLGYVWPPGPVTFVDFLKKSGRDAWKQLIKTHRDKLIFDGLWIDMNEPASFNTNEGAPWNWPKGKPYTWNLTCPSNPLEDPPYRPKAARRWDSDSRKSRLSDKSICLSAVQGDHGQYRHYDVHSLYGWSQTEPTLEAVRETTGERGVVIARSTFTGTGRWAGHWLGDNRSIWKSLRRSIIGMLEFNIFGIPYIGADICGFNGNTTEELCLRWMQLGAFYPFSRNHNAIGNKDQAPGQLGDRVGNASAEIMNIRYRLLPYLYTLFHHSHTQGSTVVRPMHHEFPTDRIALGVDMQFMWGSCLLISPILEEGQKELVYYLPKGLWYSYFTHDRMESPLGKNHTEQVTLGSMPQLHIRGGCVLVEQQPANNTYFSRQKSLEILVSPDNQGFAVGTLFWDDGVSIDTFKNGNYLSVEFRVQNSKLTVQMTHQASGNPNWQRLKVAKILVMGVSTNISSVNMNREPQFIPFSQKRMDLEISLKDTPLDKIQDIAWR